MGNYQSKREDGQDIWDQGCSYEEWSCVCARPNTHHDQRLLDQVQEMRDQGQEMRPKTHHNLQAMSTAMRFTFQRANYTCSLPSWVEFLWPVGSQRVQAAQFFILHHLNCSRVCSCLLQSKYLH